ncbi:hypothetical protein Poli38472_012090 [Pythium oligandrum]|uniref:Uncharacterized protein n=1 Tax=Pythium oligandrum TaxID=41045 RepID=A0A8K1FN58_PYTOL|nr:hypothetical protein Poli38472_012090 [Pythium oligandrum]|eukprot:TMW66974.1 hypothetical protein Poli38472_012090 [Pythium oligandrum]
MEGYFTEQMAQQQNGESARSGHNASLAHLSALTIREPFSPQHLGHPLPYLDVFSFQSKRLLPVSRQDLLQQRTKYRPEVEQVLLWARRGHVSHVQSTNSESDEEYDSEESNDDDSVASGAEEGHEEPPDSTEHAFAIPSHHIPAYDELARRLLLEPIQLPDLIHTGVDSKYLKAPSQASPLRQQQVPDAEVKLFYASGAKNTNMREYIKETIEKHMGATSPTGKTLKDSASAPVLAPEEVSTAETTETKQRSPTKSPAKRHKTKGKHKQTVLTSRLIASVSTSALLNPELRRQAQEVLTQIRANAHKVNDLIGST